MQIITTASEMREWSRARRTEGKRIGLVPTMGALHEGHLSLMRAAVDQNDVSIASVFVNPAQFAPNEDFEAYPRDFAHDQGLAEEAGITVIYAPKAEAVYPEGYTTYVSVDALDQHLCSSSRPHFFRGVATVVAKLFNTCEPDRAYFGQKDAQQAAIIRRMVRDLEFAVEIVEMPIVRAEDGLALSSRNQYLSPSERERALALSRALFTAERMIDSGQRDAGLIGEAMRQELSPHVDRVDYAEAVDPDEIVPLETIEGRALLAVAAFVGGTRLIDNIKVHVPPQKEEEDDAS